MSRYGILDLGTNTFKLVVFENNETGFSIIYDKAIPAYLGKGSINKGFIDPSAFDRAVEVLLQHKAQLAALEVDNIRVIGTSAIRMAANKNEFLSFVQQETGFDIEVIDGETEAELTYLGVKLSGLLQTQKELIVDIGGGSVEFIIASNDEVYWKKSLEIGTTRLLEQFTFSDPPLQQEIETVMLYLESKMSQVFEKCRQMEVSGIVGASNVFETLMAILAKRKGQSIAALQNPTLTYDLQEHLYLVKMILGSAQAERLDFAGMPQARILTVIPALIIINTIAQNIGAAQFKATFYSLKEGAFAQMIHSKPKA